MSLKQGTSLGPYKIESLLGEGGMGQVYRATDTRLGRTVAVKVLPAPVVRDPERLGRFDREARAIASLSHPHICALFDIGMQDEIKYLVMEYIEGETLEETLSRGGLSAKESLHFGAQIAGALNAAHAKGILHRDLKPANVIVTDNGAKVLDFGLAKFLEPGSGTVLSVDDAPTELATVQHTVLGTAQYMSPEQARGQDVDSRTDAWSFGILLYEILAGRRPFKGDTFTDILAAILRDEIDWDLLPTETPVPVLNLLKRMTVREADQRLGDLGEAAAVLHSVSSGLTMLTVPETIPSTEGDHSIAVIPFANNSPDPDNEYFSDGLTEEVISDLSRINALRVISRTTAMRLKGMEKDLRSIVHELEVRYVLEGSVRKAGNNLRITTQLIDTQTDTTVWADKYSGTLDDVFEIQEQVSRAIVDSLRLTLSVEEEQRLVVPAVNPIAYDTFLKARRDIWSFTKEGLDRAVHDLEQALEIVGDNVLLYRGLGLANWQYVNGGLSSDKAYIEKTEKYARKIMEIEPGSHHGASLLGNVAIQRGDVIQWVRQFEYAVAAEPRDPEYLLWLGLGWGWAGFPDRALLYLNRLKSIEPLFDILHYSIGGQEFLKGNFEGALPYYEKARKLNPVHPAWPIIFAQGLASTGQIEKAIAEVDEKAQAPESHPLTRVAHAFKFALLGDAVSVDEMVTDDLVEVLWGDFQYTHFMAQCYSLLNQHDKGFKWLERAVERGYINYPYLSEFDPLLENLRPDPRFSVLMGRVKLQWEGFEAAVKVGSIG